MFCPKCGREFAERVNYCCQCGAAMVTPSGTPRKLSLSRTNKKIAGVCGGLAEYLDMDPTLVRVAWVMMALVAGWGVVGYLVAWLIIPEQPQPQAKLSPAPLTGTSR